MSQSRAFSTFKPIFDLNFPKQRSGSVFSYKLCSRVCAKTCFIMQVYYFKRGNVGRQLKMKKMFKWNKLQLHMVRRLALAGWTSGLFFWYFAFEYFTASLLGRRSIVEGSGRLVSFFLRYRPVWVDRILKHKFPYHISKSNMLPLKSRRSNQPIL